MGHCKTLVSIQKKKKIQRIHKVTDNITVSTIKHNTDGNFILKMFHNVSSDVNVLVVTSKIAL